LIKKRKIITGERIEKNNILFLKDVNGDWVKNIDFFIINLFEKV
jgi:hypothetical protein